MEWVHTVEISQKVSTYCIFLRGVAHGLYRGYTVRLYTSYLRVMGLHRDNGKENVNRFRV